MADKDGHFSIIEWHNSLSIISILLTLCLKIKMFRNLNSSFHLILATNTTTWSKKYCIPLPETWYLWPHHLQEMWIITEFYLFFQSLCRHCIVRCSFVYSSAENSHKVKHTQISDIYVFQCHAAQHCLPLSLVILFKWWIPIIIPSMMMPGKY